MSTTTDAPKVDKKSESAYQLLKELCTKLMETKNVKVDKADLKKKVDGATKVLSDMYKSMYVVAKCPTPIEPIALAEKHTPQEQMIYEQQKAAWDIFVKMRNANEGVSAEQLKMKGLIYGAVEALTDILPADYITTFKKRIIEE
jgi:hypothetical protein